jgi:hypothetical protein
MRQRAILACAWLAISVHSQSISTTGTMTLVSTNCTEFVCMESLMTDSSGYEIRMYYIPKCADPSDCR